jgi:ABC-type sulfate/molybdate transport systems ATPase subunit
LAETRLPPEAWDRRPAQLSGGEGQRVALARALALNPDLLLLDEPLSQVDMMLRAEMLELIRTAVASRKATVIYVTHSWPEVLELCERIAVLSNGRIVQEGPTTDVFQCPVDSHVARLTGAVVEVPAELVHDGHIGCDVKPPDSPGGEGWHVRPHQVQFAAPAGRNCWQILQAQPHGNGWRVVLQLDDRRWTLVASQRPEPGTVVAVSIAAATAGMARSAEAAVHSVRDLPPRCPSAGETTADGTEPG